MYPQQWSVDVHVFISGGFVLHLVSPAALTAVFDAVPVALPFFAPGELEPTNRTCFVRQVRLLAVFHALGAQMSFLHFFQ